MVCIVVLCVMVGCVVLAVLCCVVLCYVVLCCIVVRCVVVRCVGVGAVLCCGAVWYVVETYGGALVDVREVGEEALLTNQSRRESVPRYGGSLVPSLNIEKKGKRKEKKKSVKNR